MTYFKTMPYLNDPAVGNSPTAVECDIAIAISMVLRTSGVRRRLLGVRQRSRKNSLADFPLILRCSFRTALMMVHEVPVV